MIFPEKQTAVYRGFILTAYQYRKSGDWDGMAKGLGTVVFSGGAPKGTAGEVINDLTRRIDLGYERAKGVFAGKGA